MGIFLHALAGAAIFLVGFAGGLARERHQHHSAPLFPLKGWLNTHRLLEAAAWGIGAEVLWASAMIGWAIVT